MKSPSGRLYFSCLLLLAALGSTAQQLSCGTNYPNTGEQTRFEEIVQQVMHSRIASTQAEEVYYVPLKIHIVRHSNGEVAIAENIALANLTAVNKHFWGAGLQFYLVGDFNYIELDQAFYLKVSEDHILTDHKVQDVVNLFYPYSIDQYNAYAKYPPDAYAVIAGYLNDPSILIHEFGHIFFLKHTHDGNDSDPEFRELVDGSNCLVRGDQICDTPADPYGVPGATGDCFLGYTGTISDLNGDLFAPMTENFMSYWSCSYIYGKFTLQQYEMIRLVYENYFGTTGYYPFNNNQEPVNAPTALMASFHVGEMTPSFAQLAWQDNSLNESCFHIERSAFPNHGFYNVGYSEKNTVGFADKTVESGQTYYYRIRPANSRDAFSNVVSIETPAFYCIPAADPCSTHSKIINSFNLSSVNTIIVNGNPPDCFSYSYLSLPNSVLNMADTYTLSLKIEANHEMYATAWIDYNMDMIFAEEEVIYSSNSAKNQHDANFNIPQNLDEGIYRLRIRAESRQTDASASCTEEYFFGEIRDVEFSITAQEPIKITWDPIDDKPIGYPPFLISAQSNAAISIIYSVVSGPALLEGNLLTLTGTGTIILRASQMDILTGKTYSEDIGFCVLPAKPLVTIEGESLMSSNEQGNQWYLNDQPIENATQQNFLPVMNGEYAVETTGPCGAGVRSEVFFFTVTGVENDMPNAGFMIYPNPVDDLLIIRMPNGYRWENIKIVDMLGITVAEKSYTSENTVSFLTQGLTAGFFVVRISTSSDIVSKRIVIKR